jgi:hypothetical protein
LQIVIASEAKQSILPQKKNGLLRRFAPRNDGFLISNMSTQSRGAMRPSFCKTVSPIKQRAQGMPGARCTRSLACEIKQSTRA